MSLEHIQKMITHYNEIHIFESHNEQTDENGAKLKESEQNGGAAVSQPPRHRRHAMDDFLLSKMKDLILMPGPKIGESGFPYF